ncbi:hypothetical protein [Maribellus sediminis]|uniref:hypothetical protein n=1 Tax=Maribellus sediminis TaxID=2696285 RepID=UPI00142F7F5E|nr:hypothetical protein [Maribellus sediminis]
MKKKNIRLFHRRIKTTAEVDQKQMKKAILILFIIGIFNSCETKVERILTSYDWEIEKVIDLNTGTINQTGKENHKIWYFSPDNTYQYKTKAENNENLIKGVWQLNSPSLLIYNEFDSTRIHIEKINREEMVWIVKENDSLRFYLNSKEKDIVVPNFPNMTKQ